jgi:hypothetical protein
MVGTLSLGTEITGAEIEAEVALHSGGPDGEQAVYRALGGLDYSKDGYKPLGRRKSRHACGIDRHKSLPSPPISDPS